MTGSLAHSRSNMKLSTLAALALALCFNDTAAAADAEQLVQKIEQLQAELKDAKRRAREKDPRALSSRLDAILKERWNVGHDILGSSW